jgi:hypothetical protein
MLSKTECAVIITGSEHAIAILHAASISAHMCLPSLFAVSKPLLQAVFMSVHDAAIAQARGI